MTSEETKNIYIKEFESTTIDVRQPINRDNFYFNMNFVGKPFFEIKGETDKKFKVS